MISQYEKYADMISFTNMIPWQSSYDNPINEVKNHALNYGEEFLCGKMEN